MSNRSRFRCDETGGPGERPSKPDESPIDIFTSTEIPTPSIRPLNVYAFDPSLGNFVGNQMITRVSYEELEPGPVGDRFAVIDYDGGQRTFYKPVNLDDPRLLMTNGLPPSEGDPRFHQQMVYAVASETLQRFEYALGRRVRWRTRLGDNQPHAPKGASRRLNLFPHAMCEANAFYSPDAHGILFGYFKASQTNPGRNLPGQTVFICLSHDIIVHETTHAIVDGIREYFMEPSNVDVAAFHEAFADLAALFLHFSHEEVLIDTLQKTGGKLFDFKLKGDFATAPGATPVLQSQLDTENPLIALATQFGEAAGRQCSLRSALTTPPTTEGAKDIATKTEPHERGSILVAAVFDAYFTVYGRRTFDLFRIYRAGGGSLEKSDLPSPLAGRLAAEASRTAEEFFTICARALDYCPPVDITFGDFLRALLTAHLDYSPDDRDHIRDALMQAFRLRGIYAEDANSFSEDALFWPKAPSGRLRVPGLVFGDPNGLTKEEKDRNGDVLRAYAAENAEMLGFDRHAGAIAAPSFHPMFHTGKDGKLYVTMVVELVQTMQIPFGTGIPGTFPMRNGVTLLIAQDPPDRDERPDPRIRFVIPKLYKPEREERIRSFYIASGRAAADNASDDNSRFRLNFALLHAGV
ncbi:peptidase M4 [Bradyrhizobium sp. HKCCYLS1011]|uniref:peptidase M4 n=1 Tax=Bradyrhizobium sp. HKCCYLS1011 TaxID=3420733 RepID=UPI003EC0E6F8